MIEYHVLLIGSIQRPEVKGTLVDGNQELPEMKLPVMNFAASVELVITFLEYI